MVATTLQRGCEQEMGQDGKQCELSAAEAPVTVLHQEDAAVERRALMAAATAGLTAPLNSKSLPSIYFYDDAGSKLYQDITDLEEYYPTRTEASILTKHAAHIASKHIFSAESSAAWALDAVNVVELGAGDGHKTRVLLDACVAAAATKSTNSCSAATRSATDVEYFPLDISAGAIKSLLADSPAPIRSRTHGVVADNVQGLSWVRSQHSERRNVVLFLGSSIGNYDRASAVSFLREIRAELREGDLLLIGFDLRKSNVRQLVRAYDDAKGVTAAFNRNLLTRLNREFDCGFEEHDFDHYASWNPRAGCMESWLVAQKRAEVRIGGEQVVIEEAEAIHTEVSYKYSVREIESMARQSGFEQLEVLHDENCLFADAIWRVQGCAENELSSPDMVDEGNRGEDASGPEDVSLVSSGPSDDAAESLE